MHGTMSSVPKDPALITTYDHDERILPNFCLQHWPMKDTAGISERSLMLDRFFRYAHNFCMNSAYRSNSGYDSRFLHVKEKSVKRWYQRQMTFECNRLEAPSIHATYH